MTEKDPDWLKDKKVLEIGCGLARPGVLCATLGAIEAVLQDNNPEVVSMVTQENIELNSSLISNIKTVSFLAGSRGDLPQGEQAAAMKEDFDLIILWATLCTQEYHDSLNSLSHCLT